MGEVEGDRGVDDVALAQPALPQGHALLEHGRAFRSQCDGHRDAIAEQQEGQRRLAFQRIEVVVREGVTHLLAEVGASQAAGAQRHLGRIREQHQLGDQVLRLDAAQGVLAQAAPVLDLLALAEGPYEVRSGIKLVVAHTPGRLEQVALRCAAHALVAVQRQRPEVGGRRAFAEGIGRNALVCAVFGKARAIDQVDVRDRVALAIGQRHRLLQGAALPGGVAVDRALLAHEVVHAGAGSGHHQHVAAVLLNEVRLVGGERGRDGADRLRLQVDGAEFPDRLHQAVRIGVERGRVGALALTDRHEGVDQVGASEGAQHDQELRRRPTGGCLGARREGRRGQHGAETEAATEQGAA